MDDIHILFTHSWEDIWVVLHFLAIIYNAAMNIHAQIFYEHTFSILLSILYPQVKLLDHVITVKKSMQMKLQGKSQSLGKFLEHNLISEKSL